MYKIMQYHPFVKKSWAKQVYKTIRQKQLGPGTQTRILEHSLAQLHYCNNCICTTSGTTALMVAIKSLGLPKGSTILFPAYSFIAGAHAAKFLGYRVKLVDVSEETMCMDPKKVKITPSVSCVIFIDHNGYHGTDLHRIQHLCRMADVPLIEDSSQCINTSCIGNCGDISVLSFSVPKLITSGQGGAILTNNCAIAQKCREIIDHGGADWRRIRSHSNLGINLRFDDIHASYLLAQLKDINELLTKRTKVFNLYKKYGLKIEEHFCLTATFCDSTWMAIYRAKYPDEIISELEEHKIQAVKYYKPINFNKLFKTKTKFPIAEKISNEAIYLPSGLGLTEKQVKKICKIVLETEKICEDTNI